MKKKKLRWLLLRHIAMILRRDDGDYWLLVSAASLLPPCLRLRYCCLSRHMLRY